ncbi:MAG: glutathione S-transferase family protein [Rhodospirillales bacterium]|nr:glutathione S-transferase family protein [Rhodospirillales bacterium]
MSDPQLTLVSHHLCPYVQRATIALAEKAVPFERIYIDLANKPDWFQAISPLGKTPVLMVGDRAVFESAAILEYLEETQPERLHPQDPLARAAHRGWIEFGSSVLNDIWGFYVAPDAAALTAKARALTAKFDQVEQRLGEGPYFEGGRFCLVDAVFGPVFRYFDVFDTIGDFHVFDGKPKVGAWRQSLAARPSIKGAVGEDYNARLWGFLKARNSYLSTLMTKDRRLERSMPNVPAVS